MPGVAKLTILGNDYVGAFALATDAYSIICRSSTKGEATMIESTLDTKVAHLSVGGSDLVGIYGRGNSHALLFSDILYKDELAIVKKHFPKLEVHTIESDLNAVGNNVLANDKIAIINPNYTKKEAKQIADALDVEVIHMAIGGFETVGANNILTNKGIVLNNNVSDKEMDRIKEVVKSVSQSTANVGSLSIGLCALANSNGLLVGKTTTGYEMASMTDGLML